jgi:SAM-dependent methyltransferase
MSKIIKRADIARFANWRIEDVTKLINNKKHGWSIASIQAGLMHGLDSPQAFLELDLWSKNYLQKGHLWSNEPSETVRVALSKIPDDGAVLDVGFGYGRDLIWAAQRRSRVIGIEKSAIGLNIAMNSLRKEFGPEPPVDLIFGSMKTHRFAKGALSGIFSHRVLHLPNPETALPDIARNMADAVKVGGHIVVSARSMHDFYQDKDRMHEVILDKEGFPLSAEYKDRPGHRVNYFSATRFQQVFGPFCNIIELHIGKEPESEGNVSKDGKQVYSYYMTAVMNVLEEDKRSHAFGYEIPDKTKLPEIKRLPSIPQSETIELTPLSPEV